MNRRAQVWLHDRCTGILEENADGFRFTYLQSHVMDARRPISASLPVRSQPYESPRLFPFFEGMLAEARFACSKHGRPSFPRTIVLVCCWRLALKMLQGLSPSARSPRGRLELDMPFQSGSHPGGGVLAQGASCAFRRQGRDSLPATLHPCAIESGPGQRNAADVHFGVQDKVQLRLVRGKLSIVGAGGDFLLKPVPSSPLHWAEFVPANEHLCMQIAGRVFRIETPPNALVLLADDEPAYLVRRYDRNSDQADGRLHQEDLGQVMGRSLEDKNWKYHGSYEEMAAGIRISCPAHGVALERLWQRIVFCFAIGNGDAHWKNFSVLEDPMGGYRLAPAYDLVSTSLHFPMNLLWRWTCSAMANSPHPSKRSDTGAGKIFSSWPVAGI
jgi:HipA-like protein